MFNWFRKESESIPERVIGEVYCYYTNCTGETPAHVEYVYDDFKPYYRFVTFNESHVDWNRNHDDFFCIRGHFHKKENIVFYNDVYQPMRDAITKKFAKCQKQS